MILFSAKQLGRLAYRQPGHLNNIEQHIVAVNLTDLARKKLF